MADDIDCNSHLDTVSVISRYWLLCSDFEYKSGHALQCREIYYPLLVIRIIDARDPLRCNVFSAQHASLYQAYLANREEWDRSITAIVVLLEHCMEKATSTAPINLCHNVMYHAYHR